MKYFFGIIILISSIYHDVNAEVIFDQYRERGIPVEITLPSDERKCSVESKCSVAFVSAGYGVSHLKYTFLVSELKEHGYLVVAIGHELPSDPPLSVSGNLYETRSENWIRGAGTLDFLKVFLSQRYQSFDFEKITLVGHSNGGDISAWLGNENKAYIARIITLDHRRVPLPRDENIEILSIRASDFSADNGVLPTANEQEKYNDCLVTIPKAKHNDIADFGPEWLKSKIQLLIREHLEGKSCLQLKKT